MTLLREKGEVNHDLLYKVSQARKINQVCGFEAIAPWEVGELDEEWMMVFDGLYHLQKTQREQTASQKRFDNTLARVRAKHPTYRKYAH